MFNSNCASVPLVANIDGNGNNNGWNGDGAWLIWIVLIFALFGFGGFGFGGFGGGGGAMQGYATQADIQRGFDTSNIVSKLDGITNGLSDGFYAMNTGLMNGFNGVDRAICDVGYQTQNGFNTTNITIMQMQNALQALISQCCCENREGQAQIRYDMATQACGLQNTMNNNARDIIDNQNAGTREILNYLCQKENADLRSQIQRSELTSALATERAFITANQEAQTAELVRRLGRDYPVNAVVVQPNTPVTFPVNGCGNFTGYNSCNGCCA